MNHTERQTVAVLLEQVQARLKPVELDDPRIREFLDTALRITGPSGIEPEDRTEVAMREQWAQGGPIQEIEPEPETAPARWRDRVTTSPLFRWVSR